MIITNGSNHVVFFCLVWCVLLELPTSFCLPFSRINTVPIRFLESCSLSGVEHFDCEIAAENIESEGIKKMIWARILLRVLLDIPCNRIFLCVLFWCCSLLPVAFTLLHAFKAVEKRSSWGHRSQPPRRHPQWRIIHFAMVNEEWARKALQEHEYFFETPFTGDSGSCMGTSQSQPFDWIFLQDHMGDEWQITVIVTFRGYVDWLLSAKQQMEQWTDSIDEKVT